MDQDAVVAGVGLDNGDGDAGGSVWCGSDLSGGDPAGGERGEEERRESVGADAADHADCDVGGRGGGGRGAGEALRCDALIQALAACGGGESGGGEGFAAEGTAGNPRGELHVEGSDGKDGGHFFGFVWQDCGERREGGRKTGDGGVVGWWASARAEVNHTSSPITCVEPRCCAAELVWEIHGRSILDLEINTAYMYMSSAEARDMTWRRYL